MIMLVESSLLERLFPNWGEADVIFGLITRTRCVSVPLVAILFGGCGGGGSSAPVKKSDAPTTAANSVQNTQPVSVSLSTNSSVISVGSSVDLRWTASNADSCAASGGWSGSRSPNGQETIGPLITSTVFMLNCSGTGGSVSKQVTVEVDNSSGNRIGFVATPEYLEAGSISTLSWEAEDASNCTALGGWEGSQPITGVYTIGPIDVSTTYELVCSWGSETENAYVSVRVVDRILRWRPPTQNVDGSLLTDLAGYTIHWGSESFSYSDSHSITDPSVTEWVVSMPAGSYYIAMTAQDSEGNESAYSNEVLKVIP